MTELINIIVNKSFIEIVENYLDKEFNKNDIGTSLRYAWNKLVIAFTKEIETCRKNIYLKRIKD